MGMTNTEARKHLKDILADVPNDKCIDWIDALKTAIKALEQQSSKDCISREEAIRVAEQGQIQGYEWQFKKLCTLPPVTPKPRVGRWILEEVKDEDGRPYDIKYFCSECQAERPPIWADYCSACGAKMEVVEE